jgi:hypothetical protein
VDSDQEWEAWALSYQGDFRTRPLLPDDSNSPLEIPFADDLFVATPGPIKKLGKRSVAVVFGNAVKIVTLGKELFDGSGSSDGGTLDIGLGSYKWRARTRGGRKMQ